MVAIAVTMSGRKSSRATSSGATAAAVRCSVRATAESNSTRCRRSSASVREATNSSSSAVEAGPGVHLPQPVQQHLVLLDVTAHVPQRLGDHLRDEAVGEVPQRLHDEIGLRREVVRLGPPGDTGPRDDLAGGEPRVPDLDKHLERRVEQGAPRAGPPLGLGPPSVRR